jgi:CelD/BcsL family acetyltransferase involved in cellulose biosynthesis
MHCAAAPAHAAGQRPVALERIDSIEHVETLDGMRRLAPEWQSLADARSPWLPFLGPTWNVLWWKHFAEHRSLMRDRLCVHALRAADGELVAVAPLMITERPGTGPLRVRMLQPLGADPLITEARGVACRSEHEGLAYRALLDHLEAEADAWDLMRWGKVLTGGGAHLALGASAGVEVVESAPNFYLGLPSSWTELAGRLPRNLKESLRKCYNSLKRAGLDFEFRVLDANGDATSGLERFFELHSRRAQREDTVSHNNVFGAPESHAFLRDYFRESPAGSALVFQLVIEGAVVATRIGFRSRGSLYLYYSGYEPEFGRYSVMTTLVAETLKWAIDNGIDTVNLSFGNDVSKTRWRPESVSFHEARWAAPSSRGRFLRRSVAGLSVLHQHKHFGPLARLVLKPFGTRTTNVHG